MEDYTEHEAYITAMMDREAAEAAAKDFGSSVNTLAKVRTEIAENDFEMTPIDIPTLALGEQKGEYRSGVAGTNAIYDNTISDLVPGFYRLTVKAFYRISSADIAWACHAAGMESVLACVYANDVEYPIQSLYNSYHVSPLETSDELRGGHYYSTDLTSAGETFEDAKRYLNDVYVYVSADAGKTTGTLRYGIKNPSYVPGAWLAYENITLTRIARKEFIFEGTEADPTDWETNNNWNRNTEPDEHHVVIIRHDIEIDEEVSVFELRIEDDAKVIVLPSGGLTIGAGGVKGATKSNLILKADADAKSATKGKTGYLRISPAYTGTMPEATIELFTIGYYNMGVSNGNVTYYYNTKSYDIFSTTSPCDYTFTSSNSASAVAVKGTKDTLIIYNVEEPATITVSQEENYKWNGKAQDYVINPVEQTNHIEATLTSSNYTAFAYGAPSNATWSDNGCKLGDGGLDKTACEYIIHFTGVPEYLSFNKHMDNYLGQLPVGSQSIVYQSADGSNWSQVWINEERKADVFPTKTILPLARRKVSKISLRIRTQR